MKFDWVMGCELGWFVDPKFLLCDGLDWVEEIGPMDNSVLSFEMQSFNRY